MARNVLLIRVLTLVLCGLGYGSIVHAQCDDAQSARKNLGGIKDEIVLQKQQNADASSAAQGRIDAAIEALAAQKQLARPDAERLVLNVEQSAEYRSIEQEVTLVMKLFRIANLNLMMGEGRNDWMNACKAGLQARGYLQKISEYDVRRVELKFAKLNDPTSIAQAKTQDGNRKPKAIPHSCGMPEYPVRARKSGATGSAEVRVSVTADGAIEKIEIAQSSGTPELDAAAITAFSTCKFLPATEKDLPIPAEVRLTARWGTAPP